MRKKWGGGEREGGGVQMGRKRIACIQSQTFYRTPLAHEQGVIVQFDWLVACQSKSGIRNLTFMHMLTSGTGRDQNTYRQV